jgi:hypothetical protein
MTITPFDDFMAAKSSMSKIATEVIEGRSKTHPDRTNVFIQSGSFDSCQSIVMQVMEREGQATFTLPALAANNQWCAIGHYQSSGEQLPEL